MKELSSGLGSLCLLLNACGHLLGPAPGDVDHDLQEPNNNNNNNNNNQQ